MTLQGCSDSMVAWWHNAAGASAQALRLKPSAPLHAEGVQLRYANAGEDF